MSLFGKIFDIFGNGGNNKFYARDFRNAYTLRPDQNPPRQKFQGYVNFIPNRSLFTESWYKDSAAFRTQISSLVRTATLPEVEFKTETKNQYNRKRIINTGVEYQPVDIKVFDTINNDWLTMFMKYYSYHYMNPRNKGDGTRDGIGADTIRGTSGDSISSKFGFDNGDFDSNKYGFNLNLYSEFFERIDYVLYHGNTGIQYSLFNPVLTRFRTGEIDYASSEVMEFDMTFEYESFAVYENVNFGLTDSDVSRFENGRDFKGPAFVPMGMPPTLKEQSIDLLTDYARSGQPQTEPEVSDDIVISSRSKIYGEPATFSKGTEKDKSFLGGLLSNVADQALTAAIHGRSVKNAVVSTVVGGAVSGITSIIKTPTRGTKDTVDESPGSQGEKPQVKPGGE